MTESGPPSRWQRDTLGMNTVMKASGSAEFLGMVPALAGYTPTRSIVLTPFEGTRTYGALRMDLPEDASVEFAEQVVALAARVRRTDAVAIVVYCEQRAEPTRDGLVLPHAVLVDQVIDAAEEQRLGIVDALCVTPDGWASYLVDDPSLHPLSEISAAAVPPEASPRPGDQSAGAGLPTFDLAAKERVGRALVDVSGVLASSRPVAPSTHQRVNPEALAAALLLDDIPALFEAALDLPADPPPYACAALLWLLDRPLYRDVAITQWARDEAAGVDVLAQQLDFRDTGRLPDVDSAFLMMGEGPRPDPARLRRALDTARVLAAIAPSPQRIGPLTVAAWLAWALGHATHASQHLAEAHRIDPDYSFGQLLSTLMNARPIPDWAFERRSDEAA